MKRSILSLIFGSLIVFILFALTTDAKAGAQEMMSDEEIYQERLALYLKYESLTMVPWYYLAAVDQFERNVVRVRPDLPKRETISAIYYPEEEWVGHFNPDLDDHHTASIALFHGKGLDGDGDHLADQNNDEDVLYTMAAHLAQYGFTDADFRIALWEHYQRVQSVEIVATIAELYRHFQTLDLQEKRFPVPLTYNYSYRSTWGDRRGWGGRRIHEGTDIFADYGTPVRSTTYGKVTMKGWNKYGGWRIGIRDINNNYHYYAHLSSFNKEVEVGDLIEPGTVIGYVGSSGYGPPGTSGKFPPHLHYGIYKDNGRTEWSFDPYPLLRQLELKERRQR